MERLQRINRVGAGGVHIPFEESEVDPVWRKVGHGKPVLLDGRHLFAKIDMGRRCWASPPACGRPTAGSRSDRTRQHSGNGICIKTLRSATQYVPDANRVQVTAH